ncbi:MAG: hypothetical protein Q4E33_01085 [Erysipelotrichaceae bacterium]|nr:hypothetical protein [Erysipelotrichaceae bacterium]
MKKRFYTLILVAVLLVCASVSTFANDFAIVDDPLVDTIAFTSDAHNTGDNASANRLSAWIESVANNENDLLETMAGAGDYAGYKSYFTDYWDRVKPVLDAIDNSEYIKNKGVFVAGNHEWLNGNLALSFNSTAKRIEKKRGRVISDDDYEIYCFGASSTFQLFDLTSISGLESYLKKTDGSKPIFIISHYPLHKTDERSMLNANKVVNLLNKYSEGRDIYFIWGHNHTDAHSCEHNYDQIFTDTIPSKGGDIAIKFTYAAAGCMSDSDYASGAGHVLGKGLVASIDVNTKEVTLTYYDKDGKPLAN